MAIFSLHHSYLGKSHTAYQPGMARMHANYITRASTCTKLMGERMPTERQALKGWLHQAELSDRKNARVVDKLMLALPVELTPEQREQLLRDYCEHVTKGRAGWVAAIHDRGKDAHNPHAHVILRDRDAAGEKVMHTTAGKKVIDTAARRGVAIDALSPEKFREAWEKHCNLALERAGIAARIDRRSNAARGIESEPGIHVGPKGEALAEKEQRPTSKPATLRRMLNRVPTSIVIDYPAIDAGRSRAQFNAEIKERNAKQKRRGPGGLPGLEWSDRGGMAAQQRSALEWFQEGKRQVGGGRPEQSPRSAEKTPGKGKPTLDEFRIREASDRGRDGPERDR